MSDRDERATDAIERMAEAGQTLARKWGHPPWSDSWARLVAEAMLVAISTDWRCECGDLNRDHEAFCYRCGAGQPEQAGDGKRMVDLDAVIEALDDVASKVLPGSDPTACVRAAAGVIEREFGGPAPSEEGESHE